MSNKIPLSFLDLAPVPQGKTIAEGIAQTVETAQQAEKSGLNRYWMAEHHNMPGIASAATAVVIGHVAGATQTMRVGAGGIMLPNHAPLVVAEQFGTLETLYPGRIDLGLGRAPGTDMATARALRRHMMPEDSFPQDVVELIQYLSDGQEDARVRAIPTLDQAQIERIYTLTTRAAQHLAEWDVPDEIAADRIATLRREWHNRSQRWERRLWLHKSQRRTRRQ